MYLDGKLNFLHYIKEKTLKINIGIGVLRKLRHILPRHSLITIYKSFVRPHFDYYDIIYKHPNNENFGIEKVQSNAALTITRLRVL